MSALNNDIQFESGGVQRGDVQRGERLFEIDVVKAVCIVAVVLNHAQDSWRGASPAVTLFLHEWPRFAVPLFLLTAGFLFNKSNIPATTLLPRLGRRIVVPYLVCSVFMLWFRATWLFEPRLRTFDPAHIALLFLSGRTLGIYYFVPLITGLYLFSLWLRTWPARWIFMLWTVLGVRWLTSGLELLSARGRSAALSSVVLEVVVVSTFMYLTGWLLSLRYQCLRPFLRRHSGWLMALALVVEGAYIFFIAGVSAGGPLYTLLTCAYFFTIFVGLMGAGLRWPVPAPAIRFLSDASYAMYLLHFPLVRAIQAAFVNEQNAAQIQAVLVPWVLGLEGTVLLILVLKRILGSFSRLLIGA